jgi:hypothetical protein
MRDNKNIIEEYRNSDSEKRLYFFLSHRSLRDEFLEIDQSDTSVEFSKKPIKNKCRMCGNWGQGLIRTNRKKQERPVFDHKTTLHHARCRTGEKRE